MVLLVGGALAFVAIGYFASLKNPLVGYLCGGFFGLCALVGMINLLPGSSYLEVKANGFTLCSLFRRTFVSWEHVREFVPYAIHHRWMVGWNYTGSFKKSSVLRKVSTALANVEAGFPDTYGLSAEELCTILNRILADYKQRNRISG